MKTVGIIGGVGPSTTAAFYMRVIQLTKQVHNARPPVVIHSIPVPATMEDKFLRTGKGIEQYESLLRDAAKALQNAGADFAVLACNSLHHLSDAICSTVDIPFVSIVDETVKYLKRSGVKRMGILGAPLTLQASLYIQPLADCGIECVVPTQEDQEVLGQIIRNIVFGEKEDTDEHRFMKVMDNLHQRGADHLLLACTDLQELESRHPQCTVHDTMEILAQAVVGVLPTFSAEDYRFYFTEEYGDDE